MKYEISKDRDEILKTIRESSSDNRNILWQNKGDGRVILDIFDFKIDPIKEIIRFNVLDPNSIEDGKPLYIKLSHRNMIFKGSLITKSVKGIFVRIPDQIKLEELREHKRYAFEATEKRQVLLEIDSSIENIKEHLNINLLDVSQSGLGIIVSPQDHDKVIRSSQVNLSTLGYFDFKSHFSMDPVYKSRFQMDINGQMKDVCKIGFRFQEFLPEQLLKDFIRSEENLFETEIGFLGKSRKFQKKLHMEYRQMLKNLEARKEFFEFFVGHGKINSLGDEYLSKHIRLLSMFSCALAKLIGIADKTVMAQLTYCAFVHDLAFFTNPKLAQIKNHEHFHRVKHLLNVYERELYFRSTIYAYDFAKSDPHAPSGSEFILKQLDDLHRTNNKEYMLAQGGISPLVSVMIVAHDLVDYVLTHPKWTFYDYLQRYDYAIYGDTFAVIYDLLNKARAAA